MPYKYKQSAGQNKTEFYIVLRLSEQYLIRAEARANLGKFEIAKSDLNVIRNRAGLGNTDAGTKELILEAIDQERQIELFTEWGHRWFDIKRRNKADSILSPLCPETWQGTDTLWPIPYSQILLNKNITQNPGF